MKTVLSNSRLNRKMELLIKIAYSELHSFNDATPRKHMGSPNTNIDSSTGVQGTRFFFISNSIFQLSLELLNTVFNIAENLRGPLLQIGVQTSFQSEFFHLVKENFENTVNFSTFC